MSETKKPKKAKKQITDIEKPGLSAPSATSKPVIVGNRPLLQDPMMVNQAAEDSDEPAPAQPMPTLSSERTAVIEPLDESLAEEAAEDQDHQSEVPAPENKEAEPGGINAADR